MSIVHSVSAQLNVDEVDRHLKEFPRARLAFEEVLNEFKDDELKRKAAFFIFNNMKNHYSETVIWVDSLGKALDYDELNYSDYKTSIHAFRQKTRLNKVKPKISRIFDGDTISADYIINHINMILKTWNKPWNKHLEFEDFCEYVLPYRVMNEPVQYYQNIFFERFEPFLDSLSDNGVDYELQCLVNMEIHKGYQNTFQREDPRYRLPLQGPLNLMHRKQGDCTNMVNYASYAMRSLGVPVTVDFTPWYSTSTGRHFWNVTWDKNGKASIFVGTRNNPGTYLIPRELGKVFRFKYSNNKDWIAHFLPENKLPHGFFRKKHIFDVTPEYGPCTDLVFNLNVKTDSPYAYISVFNGLNWKAVFFGKLNSQNKVCFKNMGRGAVYLPQIFKNNRFHSVAYPKLLRKDGTIEELRPDLKRRRCISIKEAEKYLIFRPGKKYALYYWDGKWKQLGLKVAQNHQALHFHDVPLNALLLLVPEYTNKKDRVFTIDVNGNREWW